MILIIERAQHTYVFTAFKMYRCTLNSFTTVGLIGSPLRAQKKRMLNDRILVESNDFFFFFRFVIADNKFSFSNIHAVSFDQRKRGRNLKQIKTFAVAAIIDATNWKYHRKSWPG